MNKMRVSPAYCWTLGDPWATSGCARRRSFPTGASWDGLVAPWGGLGRVLGGLGAVLERSWAILGQSWSHLAVMLGLLGQAWSHLEAVLGQMGEPKKLVSLRFFNVFGKTKVSNKNGHLEAR